jgi:hypothetical protein
MPSIKKKYTEPQIFTELDEESDSETIEMLKKKFTLEDYLKCPETREILEERWWWKYCGQCEKDLWDFYEEEQKEKQTNSSSILFYDMYNSYAGKLSALVFPHIEPQYDLQIFYDFPYLAQPLIKTLENKAHLEAEEKKRLIRENYEKNIKHKGKTFNWATKSYK